MIAGLVATLVMTAMMWGFARLGWFPEVDVAEIIAETAGVPWVLGMAAHIVLGAVVFPLFYLYALRGRLPGPHWLRGWLFGIGLFIAGEAILIPLFGGGFFSAHAEHAYLIVLQDFLAHTVYGITLGTFLKPSLSLNPPSG